jgi:ferredoxin
MTGPQRQAGPARLEVDHDLCSGTGHCREVAPEIFEVRDRRAWLAPDFDLAAADPGRLRQAEAACPWFAIAYQP